MLKKFVSSLLVLLMVAGCSSTEKQAVEEKVEEVKVALKDVNVDELLEAAGLDETTVEVDETTAKMLMDLGDAAKDFEMYVADNNTADLMAIFDCEDVDAVKDAVGTYLEEIKAQAASYAPEEIEKIDNALIEEKDGLLWVIVSENLDAAKEYIENIAE